jgi:hypothetical protein
VLARRVGVGPLGAALAGVIFAFSPPRFLRLDQVHLATIQWMPFALAFLHGYLDGGRKRDLRLAAACFTLQALTSGHGAVFLGIAMLGLVVYYAVLGAPIAIATRLRDLGVAGAALLAPTMLMVVPYLVVQHGIGLKRTLDNWAIPASSFLASPSHVQQYLLSFVPAARINETAGAYLFPGYLPLVLAALAFVIRDRQTAASPAGRPDVRVFYGLLLILAVALAAGPPIGLWPYVYWLPGLNFIRVPSRFMLLATLALAVLAGAGFDRLAARFTPKRAQLAAVVVGALLVGEFAAIPLGTDPFRVEIPSIDRWLANRPTPFVIAEVPVPDPGEMGRSERYQTTYMLHAMAGWQKTVHGYSGFVTPAHLELYRQLATFPSEEAVRGLVDFGVTYVVVHGGDYPPDERARIDARLIELQESLTLLHVDGDDRIYAVNASLHKSAR